MRLIEIIECEYKDSCPKYSEFCFNEYKDVCSTRAVLILSKNLHKSEVLSIEGQTSIKFYRVDRPYGFLSNLYKKPMVFEEREFPASEYAFLFGIFNDEEVREWAMNSPKPHLLSILAHGLFSWDMVKNWNKIRVDRMYNVLKVKFSDVELREKLLETGNSILIEDSKTDPFWGIGKKEKGKNMLGKLLMKVREEMKKESR